MTKIKFKDKFKLPKEERDRLRAKFEVKPEKRLNYSESILQRQAIQWLRLQYPNIFVFHVPNEGLHKVQYRKAQKSAGVVKGIPDIMIIERGYLGESLAIELKVGYKLPSDSQLDVMEKLSERGWICKVVWNLEDLQKLVNNYLTGTK